MKKESKKNLVILSCNFVMTMPIHQEWNYSSISFWIKNNYGDEIMKVQKLQFANNMAMLNREGMNYIIANNADFLKDTLWRLNALKKLATRLQKEDSSYIFQIIDCAKPKAKEAIVSAYKKIISPSRVYKNPFVIPKQEKERASIWFYTELCKRKEALENALKNKSIVVITSGESDEKLLKICKKLKNERVTIYDKN